MKIELKNVAVNERFSEETLMFQANLYINGVYVGTAKNDGHGGCTSYSAAYHKSETVFKFNQKTIRDAEKYCESLPPMKFDTFEMPMNLEHYIDDLVQKYLIEKENKRMAAKLKAECAKGIVYGTPDSFTTVFWRGATISDMLASTLGRESIQKKVHELKHKGHKILNTNIPQELL